jgi:hypothetical protein
MAQHVVVKPEKIAATAAVLLEESLTVPALFQREGIDAVTGVPRTTPSTSRSRVFCPGASTAGVTTARRRSSLDEYAERTVAVTFGGDIYNGVKLTDEQNEMDIFGWTKLARSRPRPWCRSQPQGRSVPEERALRGRDRHRRVRPARRPGPHSRDRLRTGSVCPARPDADGRHAMSSRPCSTTRS